MKAISLDLVRVTEAAAIMASAWIGSGNKLEADRAATEAMRDRLDHLHNFSGNVRIGEGKKDESYGLFKGDKVGMDPSSGSTAWDIAVDPIDGTTPTVTSGPEAMAVIALAGPGTMFDTEENKLRRVGNATVSHGRIAYRQHAHLGGHAIEILHALRDGVVGEDSS